MSASVPVNTPAPSRPPASPRPPTRLAILGAFEGLLIGGEVVIATYIAIALNPRLLAPSVMLVGFASGIYALHLYARRRRMS